MRLIDADALFEIMLKETSTAIRNSDNDRYKTGIGNGLILATDIIKNAPTVDPVEHSEWGINSDGYYPYCKKCNYWPEKMTDYCPGCGRQMDGKG